LEQTFIIATFKEFPSRFLVIVQSLPITSSFFEEVQKDKSILKISSPGFIDYMADFVKLTIFLSFAKF
jgi:hypothetical protein